ncbi:L-fucono-1,5-lactonase-like [Saccostrea echinata]|uniref:L-fucono-1,5-lactonase-like n=1 Tax=Saccostrea echinata TaxID=191078 RepID=UPI002A7FC42C|nr:L-fucono-1,5-lactonase-like [Saccostrea echinata]
MSDLYEIDCVDSHFHIWDLKKFQYPWPTSAEEAIFQNFSPHDLETNLTKTPVRHAVFIQCLNGTPDEAKWVISQAEKYPFIKGVVAGIDLTSPKLPEVLDDMQKYALFKGVRHILEMEKPDWIIREDVLTGLKVLEEREIPYDLLLRPPHLKYIPSVVSKFPRLKFVVDHIAMPYVKDKKIDGWREEIAEIAKYSNVYCKLSGLVTEGDWNCWKAEDFQPYIDHVLACFGIDRCMFGSDWPVCNLAKADYKTVFDLLQSLLSSMTFEDKKKIFKLNAANFYKLDLN